jgi:hypothetical protein
MMNIEVIHYLQEVHVKLLTDLGVVHGRGTKRKQDASRYGS